MNWLDETGVLQAFITLASEFPAFERIIIWGFALAGVVMTISGFWTLLFSTTAEATQKRGARRRILVGVVLGQLAFFANIMQQSFWGRAPESAMTYTSQMTADPIQATWMSVMALIVLFGWWATGSGIMKIGNLPENPDERRRQASTAFWQIFGAQLMLGISQTMDVFQNSTGVGFDTGF